MPCNCFQSVGQDAAGIDPTKHVNYTYGMVLGVSDFQQEHAYLAGRIGWALRDLVGYGVVQGLAVGQDRDDAGALRVRVEPGSAVTPAGDLVCVPTAQCASIDDWLANHAADLGLPATAAPARPVSLWVALCYQECPTDPVPIAGEPCRDESELTADSRLADGFRLEFRAAPPAQREEDALRDFVAWLRLLTVTDDSQPSASLDAFLAALRGAAGPWLSPPASSPAAAPADYLFGSPPAALTIRNQDMPDYLRAAFRLWVNELRPLWLARIGPCRGDDPLAERCLALAELRIQVKQAGSAGPWKLVDGGGKPIDVRSGAMPTLLHLRMLQEWLLAAGSEQPLLPPASPPASPPAAAGADADARYVLGSADAGLPNGISLGALGDGLLKKKTVAPGVGGLDIAVQGSDYYQPGGTDVAIGDGGTGLSTPPADGQLLIGGAGKYVLGTLTGTAKQVGVANGPGSVTLSLPQNIDATSTPTFAGLKTTAGDQTFAGVTRTTGRMVDVTLSAKSLKLDPTMHVIVCDTTKAAITAELPPITPRLDGTTFTIKQTATNGQGLACTVVPGSGNSIEFRENLVLGKSGAATLVAVAKLKAWLVIGRA